MKELLAEFNQFLDRMAKGPLMVICAVSMWGNVWLVLLLVGSYKDRIKDMQTTGGAVDSAYHIGIRSLENSGIMKDSVLLMKQREYDRLLIEKAKK